MIDWNRLGERFVAAAIHLPLEVFVFVGSFVEEIISPIPSQLVMITAGSAARLQGIDVIGLTILGVIGAVGKLLGAWIYYVLGDKLEHILIPRFGGYIGITEKDIERVRVRFQGTWKDDVALFLLRFIPIIPSAPVSIACGMIRMNRRTYVTATFLGALFRNWLYLAIGYVGAATYRSLWLRVHAVEDQIRMIVLIVVVLGGAAWSFLYLRRRYWTKHQE